MWLRQWLHLQPLCGDANKHLLHPPDVPGTVPSSSSAPSQTSHATRWQSAPTCLQALSEEAETQPGPAARMRRVGWGSPILGTLLLQVPQIGQRSRHQNTGKFLKSPHSPPSPSQVQDSKVSLWLMKPEGQRPPRSWGRGWPWDGCGGYHGYLHCSWWDRRWGGGWRGTAGNSAPIAASFPSLIFFLRFLHVLYCTLHFHMCPSVSFADDFAP